jgi:hypothetical protein
MQKYEPQYKHDCDDKSCCKFIINKLGVDYYTYGGGEGLLRRYSDSPEDNAVTPFSVMIKFGDLG